MKTATAQTGREGTKTMRLIDADALKVDWYDDYETEDGDEYSYTYVSKYQIDNAPTIDAVPVRHGRWTHERLPSTSGGSYSVIRCSECLSQFPLFETKYCPNCGAKMDGEGRS